MKVKFLSWFLFILCIQSVTILGFEDFPSLEIEDFNLSKPRFGGKLHSINVTMGLYAESDRRGVEEKHEILHSGKGQRGKGAYGGGNQAHHPRSNKGYTSLSPSTCFFYSKVMLHVTLALMGLLLPYLFTGF
ncbi:Guanine nucleotide-binding alpha-16 subunit [Melia azedarach]|uniref:Guanine nucleotide-binding alpha-16 subunit n=1 Tax=Melia azedarach TaxID=155640 RepID=A0ACC1Y4M4_MELAZ|nr:Guanine nucleotide-binding alpha-16 subunit [Melia azedarach]